MDEAGVHSADLTGKGAYATCHSYTYGKRDYTRIELSFTEIPLHTQDTDSVQLEVTCTTTGIKWNGELTKGIMGKEDKLSSVCSGV